MSKADNMLAILWLLRRGSRLTAKQLAESLEIHIRTVYRYIDALCASGVPIVSDSGHNGGYSLLKPFTDAPLFFDPAEQKALAQAARFARQAGYPFGNELERAIAKLKLYAGDDQWEAVDRHLAGFETVLAPSEASLEAALRLIEAAAGEGRTVTMRYRSSGDESPLEREVDPYGIVYWKGKWYFVGYCHLRRALRSFRAERADSLALTERLFERPAGFSARSYLLNGLLPQEPAPEEALTLRLHGRPSSIDDICKHWLLGNALLERDADSASFRLDESTMHRFLPHYLLTFGKSVAIDEPDSLRQRMIAVAEDLAAYYRGD